MTKEHFKSTDFNSRIAGSRIGDKKEEAHQ
jgi:hypothetical protein